MSEFGRAAEGDPAPTSSSRQIPGAPELGARLPTMAEFRGTATPMTDDAVAGLVPRVINYVAVPGCIPSRCGVLGSPNMPDIGAALRPCLAGDSLGNCIRTYDSGH